ATAQQVVYLRDLTRRTTTQTLRGHQRDVFGLAWAPDGQHLATGDANGRIKLWDPATGKERLALQGDRASADALAFSADGTVFAAGYDNGKVTVWQLAQRRDWATYGGKSGFVALALSDKGQKLAAAT